MATGLEKKLTIPLTEEEHRHVKALAVLKGEDMGKMTRGWLMERFEEERTATQAVAALMNGPRSG